MKTREAEIEFLAFHHPYLIDEALNGRKVFKQLCKGRHRLDLMFFLGNSYCVVEFKKTALKPADVRQLLGYCRSWSKSVRLSKRHYLVGRRPSDLDSILAILNRSKYAIELRFLGEHIPLRLQWDESNDQRRYRPYDEAAPEKDVLELSL